MHYNNENAEIIFRSAAEILKKNASPSMRLKNLWWIMLLGRARELSKGLQNQLGNKVYDGPFKGMALSDDALRLFQAPMLLGCYEQELHPVLENVIAARYDRVVNIGCSVGYYAVGLALRMPQAKIDAFDIDAEVRQKCAEMAGLNGVQDRVTVGGRFNGEDFEKYRGTRTLFLVDIEGAEKELLDPARYPALLDADLIVEMHDLMDGDISKTLGSRFAATHDVETIWNRTTMPDISGFVAADFYIDPLDHILLAWEGRDGPTPWGVFRKKQK